MPEQMTVPSSLMSTALGSSSSSNGSSSTSFPSWFDSAFLHHWSARPLPDMPGQFHRLFEPTLADGALEGPFARVASNVPAETPLRCELFLAVLALHGGVLPLERGFMCPLVVIENKLPGEPPPTFVARERLLHGVSHGVGVQGRQLSEAHPAILFLALVGLLSSVGKHMRAEDVTTGKRSAAESAFVNFLAWGSFRVQAAVSVEGDAGGECLEANTALVDAD